MERLWSPWRLAYVTGSKASGCVFCEAVELSSDPAREGLVLVRGRVSYVILNLYPYNNGHLMVVPNRHVGSFAAATADELSELMRFTRDAEIALNEAYQPQGINIGVNLGRAAGAGILEHVHIHLVPRWIGDTNFMPVLADVKVMPEYLQTTLRQLREQLESATH